MLSLNSNLKFVRHIGFPLLLPYILVYLHSELVLGDAVAARLSLPIDSISLEMIYRGLYHFYVARQQRTGN